MRTIEIEKQRTEQPFVPFKICFSDGKAYEVRRPEMLMVARTVLAVAFHKPGSRQLERIVLCDPVHVVRIEPLENGAGRRKSSSKR